MSQTWRAPASSTFGDSARKSSRKLSWSTPGLFPVAIFVVMVLLIVGFAAAQRITRYPAHFDARLRSHVAFVETETGRRFDHAIHTRLLSPKNFEAVVDLEFGLADRWRRTTDVRDSFVCTETLLGRYGRCALIRRAGFSVEGLPFELVGLPRPPVDEPAPQGPMGGSPRIVAGIDGGDLSGFYHPGSSTLFVRGQRVDETGPVIVHELTHAWQHQKGILRSRVSSIDIDRTLAYSAVVEGHARRVENAYLDSLDAPTRDVVEQAQEKEVAAWLDREIQEQRDETPERRAGRAVELDVLEWPYEAGEEFLTEIYDRSGELGLERVLRKPPTSTWQILHPEEYRRGKGPTEVTVTQPALASPYQEGDVTIGALLWSRGVARVLDDEAGDEMAALWRGDAALVYEEYAKGANNVCILDDIVGGSAAETAKLERLLHVWAAKHPAGSSMKVSRAGSVIRVRLCK